MNPTTTALLVIVFVLAALVIFLVLAVIELARQLASRNPIEAAQAKRIAASRPSKRQNEGEELTDTLSLGV